VRNLRFLISNSTLFSSLSDLQSVAEIDVEWENIKVCPSGDEIKALTNINFKSSVNFENLSHLVVPDVYSFREKNRLISPVLYEYSFQLNT